MTYTVKLMFRNKELKMTKDNVLALRIISTLAGFIILFIVAVLIFDEVKPTLVTAFWFFGACVTLFVSYTKISGSTNNTSCELSPPKEKSSTLGMVAVGLGLASIVMPYFAAVFFVPAAFICGAIAFRQGDKKFGGIGVVLAIVGVIGIIAVSNQIQSIGADLKYLSN